MESIYLLRKMARYNAWANAQIYAACTTLSDAARKRDLGAFFGSIHGTLNHLLLTDQMWLARMRCAPIHVNSLREEVSRDFAELRRLRVDADRDIVALLESYAEADLDRDLTFASIATGSQRTYPLREVWLHIGNHQTHHRGQVTALLQRLGCNYGDVDLLFMPSTIASD